MIKCLIIDDEFLARQLLEGYISKVNFLELAGLCENAMEGLDFLQKNEVDLVFLDINLPELNGINFLKSIKNKPEVIITTAYSEHALEGYQLDVIEYLLKPIYFERFLGAVNKAKQMIDLKQKASLHDSGAVAAALQKGENFFFIKTGSQRIKKIFLDKILYIESLNEYIRIHLEGENHVIHHSLKSLLDLLPQSQFIQIHRSYIINFHRLDLVEGNTVKINNIELNIGKNYRDDFLNIIKSNSIGINVNQGKVSTQTSKKEIQ
jgi:DNA-binding LytR/AlgR family response regulator